MAISAATARTDGPTSQPLDVIGWLRGRGVTVAAVTLIGVQLGLKGALLAGGYFRQDDYHYLDRAAASGFGWSYLMVVDSGHLLPSSGGGRGSSSRSGSSCSARCRWPVPTGGRSPSRSCRPGLLGAQTRSLTDATGVLALCDRGLGRA